MVLQPYFQQSANIARLDIDDVLINALLCKGETPCAEFKRVTFEKQPFYVRYSADEILPDAQLAPGSALPQRGI